MQPLEDPNGGLSFPSPSAPPEPPPPFASTMSVSSGRTGHQGETNGNAMKNTTRKHASLAASTISLVPWSTGLFDCCYDFSSCCLTCWCPCIAFGRIAEIIDRGSTSCGVSGAIYMLILSATCCSCLYSCFYRSKLRGQYFLKERPCCDCCVHCCCEGCALCQEYRQLKHLGFDMSIGWHGNMERRNKTTREPPRVQSEMKR